jgi:hypothetical protein
MERLGEIPAPAAIWRKKRGLWHDRQTVSA